LAEGFQTRYFEFQEFERKFEECISKSAVRTKFEQHSQRGKDIVSEIWQIVDSTYDQAQQLKTQKAEAKQEIQDKLDFTEQQLLLLKKEMKDKIRQMVEDVEQMVSCFRGTSVMGACCFDECIPIISNISV
jgi:mitofusin